MQNRYPIIPKPAEIQPRDGFFMITPETTIICDAANQGCSTYLQKLLAAPAGFSLSILNDFDIIENAFNLNIDESLNNLGEEGYSLAIEVERIKIRAPDHKGLFYGIQTLRQLLPVEIENRGIVSGVEWKIPCCQITDQPRFSWRGYMMDEGRHFHGMETILRTLDLMALQKLNILHWHLTEDQGWRIEIKRYPKLIGIGSQRDGTAQSWNDMRAGTHNGVPRGGFYTQNEIREIVQYAARLNISILPEIEIPGHSMAAIAAYPELSCTGETLEVPTRFGIFKDVYCVGKESTLEFLQNVLDEVMDLFPSEIIHIGGDEAPKARWKECPDCQQRIQDEGLKDVDELQAYTTNRIGAYLAEHGRRMMGWNEILGSNLFKGTIVQYWVRNKKGLIRAIRLGQKVVNSAYLDTYLDHSYALTPLSRAYKFDPVFDELDAESAGNILGLEAPMWTEWVPNRARLDYQTYPRLTAFAEVGWTTKNQRDYADFRKRLSIFIQRLDSHDVLYAPESDWEPPWYRRLLGMLTIAQPQKGVRESA